MGTDELEAELRSIRGRRKGLSPGDLIEYAKRDKESAIYAEFDKHDLWDDSVAAEMGRYAFAGKIIRRYRIKIIGNDGEKYRVRGLVSTTATRQVGKRNYTMRADVLTSAERIEHMREDCARDLLAIVRKYPDILSGSQIAVLQSLAGELGIGPDLEAVA